MPPRLAGVDTVGEAGGDLHDDGAGVAEAHGDRAEDRQPGRQVGGGRQDERHQQPTRPGMANRVERAAQLSDLRQEQVDGGQGHQQHHQGAGLDPGEGLELGVFDAAPPRCLLSKLFQQTPLVVHAAAGRRGQRQRLQQRHRGGDRLGPEGRHGAGHRPFRTDRQGEGCDELGHVLGEPAGTGRRLGEAEVDEPRVIVVVEQHVGGTKVAVGQLRVAEQGHLVPQLADDVVGDVVRCQLVEPMSVDQLGGQDGGSVAGLTGHHQRRCAHSGPLGQQGQVGLVFDLALGGRERSFVLEMTKGEPSPDPEQQVGVALHGRAPSRTAADRRAS